MGPATATEGARRIEVADTEAVEGDPGTHPAAKNQRDGPEVEIEIAITTGKVTAIGVEEEDEAGTLPLVVAAENAVEEEEGNLLALTMTGQKKIGLEEATETRAGITTKT